YARPSPPGVCVLSSSASGQSAALARCERSSGRGSIGLQLVDHLIVANRRHRLARGPWSGREREPALVRLAGRHPSCIVVGWELARRAPNQKVRRLLLRRVELRRDVATGAVGATPRPAQETTRRAPP